MRIAHVQFRQINNNEYCVTINKFRFKLVSSKVASTIFNILKLKALNMISDSAAQQTIKQLLNIK